MSINMWDLMTLNADEIPTFTAEEMERINRVHNELQEKYDPVAAHCRKTKTFPFVRPRDYADYNDKLHHVERAAGYKRRR